MFEIRTDLALEENERIRHPNASAGGISVEEQYFSEDEVRITTVCIQTEEAAGRMGKPKGTYVTLEAEHMSEPDESYHREISARLAQVLKQLIGDEKPVASVLIAGLGNRNVTPDALGPLVVDHLDVTRHLLREFGPESFGENVPIQISAIVPGVMGQTGMESQEIITAVVKETKPDLLIVVDALAARSIRRLGRTIQISDTGIHPGSGVGNYRHSITKDTIGIPVIAVGIPTVVEAATIVQDSIGHFLPDAHAAKEVGPDLQIPSLQNLFVTPKDIDAQMRQMSYTVSEGFHQAFFENRE